MRLRWPWKRRRRDPYIVRLVDLLVVANRRLAAVLAVVAKGDPDLLRAVGLDPVPDGSLRDMLVRNPMGDSYVVDLSKEDYA